PRLKIAMFRVKEVKGGTIGVEPICTRLKKKGRLKKARPLKKAGRLNKTGWWNMTGRLLKKPCCPAFASPSATTRGRRTTPVMPSPSFHMRASCQEQVL